MSAREPLASRRCVAVMAQAYCRAPGKLGHSQLEFSNKAPGDGLRRIGEFDEEDEARRGAEAQVAFILKQAEDGVAEAEVCRKAGVSDATFCNWRKKYAGLTPLLDDLLQSLDAINLLGW